MIVHDHRGRLGASRIAAILRKDPRCTEVDAWLEILGMPTVRKRTPELEESAHWGTVFEELVAVHGYERESGNRTEPGRQFDLADFPPALRGSAFEGRPALIVSLDRIVSPVEESRTIYQGKCRSERVADQWGKPGTDHLPRPELYQVVTEIHVAHSRLGCVDQSAVGVLFGGNRYCTYRVERNDTAGSGLVEQADQWWRRHILDGVEPKPMDETDCRSLWTTTRSVSVPVTLPAWEAITEVVAADKAIAAARSRREEAAVRLRCCLRDQADTIEGDVARDGRPRRKRNLVRWPLAEAGHRGKMTISKAARELVALKRAPQELRDAQAER